MYNRVHVDGKYFYLLRICSQIIVVPGEQIKKTPEKQEICNEKDVLFGVSYVQV